MNLAVLIIIGIPLAVYLLVLMFSTRDFSPNGDAAAHTAELSQEKPAPIAQGAMDDASLDVPVVAVTSAPIAQEAIAPVAETTQQTPKPAPESSMAVAAVVPETAQSAPEAIVTPAIVAVEAEQAAPDVIVTTAAVVVEAEQAAPDAITIPAIVIAEAKQSAPEQPALEIESAPVAEPTPAASNVDNEVPIPTAAIDQAVPPPVAAAVEPAKIADDQDPTQPVLSGEPLILPDDAPKYVFDYRGRLWVEKKRRGFFRQLRRPQLPPEDPTNNSNR